MRRYLQQAVPDELIEAHEKLHVTLEEVWRATEDVAHLRSVAENRHEWAMAVAREARSSGGLNPALTNARDAGSADADGSADGLGGVRCHDAGHGARRQPGHKALR